MNKKDSSFIAQIRHIVDITTLSDEDIIALREFSTGILTSTEYNKWLEDSGTNVDVEMADAMLECPEDYVEEIDLMMDRSLVPDEEDVYEITNEEWNELNGNGPKGDTYYDADEEHHHMDDPLSEDEYETMMSSQEHSIPATPHADKAIKMMRDTRALLEDMRDSTDNKPITVTNSYYDIFHPIDGECNTACTTKGKTFKKVGRVLATSLENAFRNSQNEFNSLYAAHGIRSTSVGDIIRKDVHYYMVGSDDFIHLGLEYAGLQDTSFISFQ